MKKSTRALFSLLLAALLVLSAALPALAAQDEPPIRVELDGRLLAFDVQPQLVDGRAMAPVRTILEALGADVAWDEASETVTASTAGGDVLRLTIGSTALYVNDSVIQMDVAPFLAGGRTLAPLRFVAEALGRDVQWESATRTVLIGLPFHLEMRDMTFELADAAPIEVHDFHFGIFDGILNWAGEPVPAPLAGIIAAPDTEGPHPLVVILHGNALAQPEVQGDIHARVYSGFDYLVRQLAAEGYVAISINVSIDYSLDYGESIWGSYAYGLFKEHLYRLELANAGEDVGHGLDLTGMVDLDNIHIIGHSRGGELADTFVRRDDMADLSRIRSIIRLAPTVLPYFEEEGDAPHPDIPLAIILPEFDGDVQSLEGQVVFDQVMMESRNQSGMSLVFLRGANHNWFNRFIPGDDGRFQAGEFYANRLTRAEQEDFLTRYAAAFLAWVKQYRLPSTFDLFQPQPVTMFGHHVTASTYFPEMKGILEEAQAGVPAATATGSATAEFYVQDWDAEGLFSHPGVLHRQDPRLPLYDLQWTDTDGAVSFSLTEADFSRHQALSLYLAMDSSNPLNPAGQDQGFTIRLKDGSGNEFSLPILPGTSALTWHPGYAAPLGWTDGYYWVGHMPLGELRIPLRNYVPYGTLDLSDIVSLTIAFDQTPSGAVMLSEIFLISDGF